MPPKSSKNRGEGKRRKKGKETCRKVSSTSSTNMLAFNFSLIAKILNSFFLNFSL